MDGGDTLEFCTWCDMIWREDMVRFGGKKSGRYGGIDASASVCGAVGRDV